MDGNLSAALRRALACLFVIFLGAGVSHAGPYAHLMGKNPGLSARAPEKAAKPSREYLRERMCLAKALYFEARSESELGQIAVAQVILNRMKSRLYPDTICKVVYQNQKWRNACQFSFACDGKSDRPTNRVSWRKVRALTDRILAGATCENATCPHPVHKLDRATRQSTHYHATYVRPRWSRKLRRARRIGVHIFYVSRKVVRASRDVRIATGV